MTSYLDIDPEYEEEFIPSQAGKQAVEEIPTQVGSEILPEGLDIADEFQEPFVPYKKPNVENPKETLSTQPEESRLKSAVRTAIQVPFGLAKSNPALMLWEFAHQLEAGGAEADLQEMEEHVNEIRQAAGIPIPEKLDRENFRKNVEEAKKYPGLTLQTFQQVGEDYGAPFMPKNWVQQMLNIGSTAGAFSKGQKGFEALSKGDKALEMLKTGASAGALSKYFQYAGLDDHWADMLALAIAPYKNYDLNSLFKRKTSNRPPQPGVSVSKELPRREQPVLEELKDLRQAHLEEKVANQPKVEPSTKVLDEISPGFRNTTEGGQDVMQYIRNQSEKVYNSVRSLYKNSRALNENISTIRPDIYSESEAIIDRLGPIERSKLTPIESKQLDMAKKMKGKLAEFNPETGEFIDFKDVSNQALIDDIQALNHDLDFNFHYGEEANKLRPFRNALEDSIENAAQGNPEALLSWIEARQAHSGWKRMYDNKLTRNIRNASNQNYSSTLNSIANSPDKLNIIRNIFDVDQRGRELFSGMQRQFAEKKFGKFLDKPHGANMREFNNLLKESEAVLSPDQVERIRSEVDSARKVRPQYSGQPTEAEKALGNFKKVKPGDIRSQLNDVDGIKEWKQAVQENPKMEKVFDTAIKQQVRRRLQDQQVKKILTGKDLESVINKQDNYEIFSEIFGQEVVDDTLKFAEDAANQEIMAANKSAKKDKLLNFIKDTTKISGVLKILEFLGHAL